MDMTGSTTFNTESCPPVLSVKNTESKRCECGHVSTTMNLDDSFENDLKSACSSANCGADGSSTAALDEPVIDEWSALDSL